MRTLCGLPLQTRQITWERRHPYRSRRSLVMYKCRLW